MTHPRKTIRAALVAHLDDGSIVDAGRVYSDRGYALNPDELPAINLFMLSEDSSPLDTSTKRLRRTVTVNVSATTTVEEAENLDDALDDLAEKLEEAFNADDLWDGYDANLIGTAASISNEGDRPIGTITLTFTLRYFG